MRVTKNFVVINSFNLYPNVMDEVSVLSFSFYCQEQIRIVRPETALLVTICLRSTRSNWLSDPNLTPTMSSSFILLHNLSCFICLENTGYNFPRVILFTIVLRFIELISTVPKVTIELYKAAYWAFLMVIVFTKTWEDLRTSLLRTWILNFFVCFIKWRHQEEHFCGQVGLQYLYEHRHWIRINYNST